MKFSVACSSVLYSLSLPTRGAWIEIGEPADGGSTPWSLPTRGAWIEMEKERVDPRCPCSRSPHGERGLKYAGLLPHGLPVASLPTRGAWIEIRLIFVGLHKNYCRSPHGERGLKLAGSRRRARAGGGRSPHGERGLKFRGAAAPNPAPSRSPHGERGLKCG